MKVLMLPSPKGDEIHGIARCTEAWYKHLPKFGVELVKRGEKHDILAVHAGYLEGMDVAHWHGLYWTGDYSSTAWHFKANMNVIRGLRTARVVTAPSEWVAHTIRRELRLNPVVITHGIDYAEWPVNPKPGAVVLWNKNRAGDVCSPHVVGELAERFPKVKFLTTLKPKICPSNVTVIGIMAHSRMKQHIYDSAVYLSTAKETGGIGTLEALASGKAVLGWREGGILDFVQHNVNGYLAEPGNLDDLERGLRHILKHWRMFSENARETVKAFTWEASAEKVAQAYDLALRYVQEPPTVGVVIPCHNYADKLERVVKSVQAQTYDQITDILIMDDSSTDNTHEVVKDLMCTDPRIQYMRVEFGNVADTRNEGMWNLHTKYLLPLDADDAIEPEHVRMCVDAQESDPTLGITFTGTTDVLPDGKTRKAAWPPAEWSFDRQVKGFNQVPTCSLLRTEMFRRVGGYRRRYAMEGAGSEDGNFWLLCGAHGWAAKKVTPKPLFKYSLGTGLVSGAKGYKERNWRDYPWVKDGLHPFPSYATPLDGRMSHRVYQYDAPVVSAVIPVGPHHVAYAGAALDSLERQTFREWDAIVVWDTDAKTNEMKRVERSFPYARFLMGGGHGPGNARNLGASKTDADFLVFLDADDELLPHCLSKMLTTWNEYGHIVYTDYLAYCHLPDPNAVAKPRLHRYEKRLQRGYVETPLPDYDHERAIQQPREGKVAYTWCLISTWLPRLWFEGVGGFKNQETLEDYDLYIRLAKADHRFRRIPEPLMIYNMLSGTRRKIATSSKTRDKHVASLVADHEPGKIRCRFTVPGTAMRRVVGRATRHEYGQLTPGCIVWVYPEDLKAGGDMFTRL
jgi:glycosyltransferase involved in cell wall biosynthesis